MCVLYLSCQQKLPHSIVMVEQTVTLIMGSRCTRLVSKGNVTRSDLGPYVWEGPVALLLTLLRLSSIYIDSMLLFCTLR